MFDFPLTTVFGRKIEKKKFYDKLNLSPDVKRRFVDEIDAIKWQHKFSSETLNVAPGKRVKELELIEIALKGPTLSACVVEQIEKAIPYPLVFVVTFEGTAQARMTLKEETAPGKFAVRAKRHFETSWMPLAQLKLTLSGLDMDAVHDNFLRQIAGFALADFTGDVSEAVARHERRLQLEKEIAALEKKMAGERQPKRRLELFRQLVALRAEHDTLSSGANA